MERVEVAKYVQTATWRKQLERQLKVSSMITSYTTLQAFNAGRLLNIFWGVGLVVAGQLEPTMLLMAVINLQIVVNSTRALFNQLPQLFMVMEPLERLTRLLEARPKIEPAPESYDATLALAAGGGADEASGGAAGAAAGHGRRPERYEGRFVFKGVHFAYPTEKQKKVLNGLSFTVRTRPGRRGARGVLRSESVLCGGFVWARRALSIQKTAVSDLMVCFRPGDRSQVEPGQKVALVGRAGCGKSTAITLVQRFYDCLQGSVELDGQPLQSYDLHHLRAHMGVVSQVMTSSSHHSLIPLSSHRPLIPSSSHHPLIPSSFHHPLISSSSHYPLISSSSHHPLISSSSSHHHLMGVWSPRRTCSSRRPCAIT
jgi:ABC-type multidrug transport system fused ATPase/permease subunit